MTENTCISNNPSQKLGTLEVNIENDSTDWSSVVPRLTADNIPTGSAMALAISSAMSVSRMVGSAR